MPSEKKTTSAVETEAHNQDCQQCGRSARYCVCAFATKIDTRIQILVLQHPQEPGVAIGTAPIIDACFSNARVVTGLSWSNIKRILGEDVTYQEWGVLYLGSIRTEALHPPGLYSVTDKGVVKPNQKALLSKLKGIIILDGTWSQAKTLWWRNAWLLKLQRLVVCSEARSVYDAIRKEPRKGCLSSIEALAESLDILERSDGYIQEAIQKPLGELVARLQTKKREARPSQHRRRRHAR
jgi:DTW domain-containing protein YfiP